MIEPIMQQADLKPLSADGIRIGLWGTIGSGKTTYLHALTQYVTADGYRIKPGNPEAKQFVKDSFSMDEDSFPPRTEPNPESIKAYRFEIWREGWEKTGIFTGKKTNKSAFLHFIDAGGEWYRNTEQMLEQHANELNEARHPVKALRESQGLLCLLDTEVAMALRSERTSLKGEFARDLFSLFTYLGDTRSSGYVKPFIAMCLSKIDVPGAWSYRKKPFELVESIFPSKVLKVINDYCDPDRIGWFGISSVGVMKDEYGQEVSIVDSAENRIIDPEQVNPFNLLEPLVWLLYHISGDKSWLLH